LGFFAISNAPVYSAIFVAVECAAVPTVEHAIDVAATPDDCWRVFHDLATWPRWFPFLRGVRGELRAGGRITLLLAAGPGSLSVDCTVEEFAPGARVRWIGGKLGVTGNHSYTFATKIAGITRVTSSETFSGLGARLIVGPVLAKLDGEVHQSMERFKALVEARHS
jgi:uncharacterized membrane protein